MYVLDFLGVVGKIPTYVGSQMTNLLLYYTNGMYFTVQDLNIFLKINKF